MTLPARTISVMGTIRRGDDVGAFNPASLFAAGEKGIWFDASDTTKMFTKNCGQSNITGSGQDVGLILDASQGLALGANLMTNGNNGAFTSDITGVSSTGGAAISRDTTIFPSGSLKVVANGGELDGAIMVNASTTAGLFYKVSGKVYVPSTNTVDFATVSVNPLGALERDAFVASTTDTVLEIEYYFRAVSSSTPVYIYLLQPEVQWGADGDTVYITDVSVQSIAGNHLQSTTTATRPTYNVVGGIPRLSLQHTTFDFMICNNFDQGGSDELFMSVALTKKRDSTAAVFEVGDTVATTDGSWNFIAPYAPGGANYFGSFRGNGTKDDITTSGSYPNNSTNVVTQTASISAPSHAMFVDGSPEGSNTNAVGAGNFNSSATLYFGRRNQEPAVNAFYFSGDIYGFIIRNKIGTAQDRSGAEEYLAGLAGVTL